jgi:adenylyltransferase/sulfurtransferase
VGAGGLGSAVIGYLAAAGVGKLGIVDGDVVEENNLQRQLIHAGNVGLNKAESAALFVEKLNPEVSVEIYPYHITPENARKLVARYDVIAGCPDNFETRYLLNDTCKLENKPFVHAAVYSYEGEVAVFTESPCYRCYIPRAGVSHSRAILGSTAGVFGSIQAGEVIKLVTGSEGVLKGEILRGDLSSMEFIRIKIERRVDCPLCSGKLKEIFPENYQDECEVRKL